MATMNNSHTETVARFKIEALRAERELEKEINGPLMVVDEKPKPATVQPIKPHNKKKDISWDAVLKTLEICQPAAPAQLRKQLRDSGYYLRTGTEVARLSDMVYKLKKQGRIKQLEDGMLILPDYSLEAIETPPKPTVMLQRDAVIAALAAVQPAQFEEIKAHLFDAGFDVASYRGRKRLSSTLAQLKVQGMVDLDNKTWRLTDTTKQPAQPADAKPVAKAIPSTKPAPPVKPTPTPIDTYSTQCIALEASIKLSNKQIIHASIAANGIAVLRPTNSSIATTLDELNEITERLRNLSALLDASEPD
jgi:hypothetical protein